MTNKNDRLELLRRRAAKMHKVTAPVIVAPEPEDEPEVPFPQMEEMDDVGVVSDETIKAWVDEEKAIAKAPFRVVKTDGRSASLEAKGCLSVASQIVEERRPDAPGMAVYGD